MTSLKPFDVVNIIARNEGEEARLTIRNKMGNPTQIPVRLSSVDMESSTDGTTVTITSKVEYGYRTPDYEPRYLGKWDEKNKPEVPTAIDFNKLAKQRLNEFYGSSAFKRDSVVTKAELKAAMYGEWPKQNPHVIPPLVRLAEIKNVIHNSSPKNGSVPATIVYWTDGTKTVVKAVNEEYDPEKGIAMAFMKKTLGNRGNYFNQIKPWLPKQTEAKAEQDVEQTEAKVEEASEKTKEEA